MTTFNQKNVRFINLDKKGKDTKNFSKYSITNKPHNIFTFLSHKLVNV